MKKMNQINRKNERLSDLIGDDEFSKHFERCNNDLTLVFLLRDYVSEHGMDKKRAFRALANHYYGPSVTRCVVPERAVLLLKEAEVDPEELIEPYLQSARYHESTSGPLTAFDPINAAKWYEKAQDKENAQKCISEYIEDSYPYTKLGLIPHFVSYELVEYTFEQYLKKMKSSEKEK